MKSFGHSLMLRCTVFFILTLGLSSCATFYPKGDGSNLPPILAQDEIIRPYTTLGRIRLSADMFIARSPDPQEWGRRALREQAARMGADAVMFPEISGRPAPHLVVPANEYSATGVAIRFK